MKKKIIIFMPSIEGGGVEKNLFIVSNYLANKHENVSLITISKKFKSKFSKKLNFISLNSNIWDKTGRRFKYFLSLFLLIKEIISNRNLVVFSFQANIFCIILCRFFFIRIVARSNSAPIGWSKNIFKRLIFKIVLNLANKVMVNSKEFKKDLKREFNVSSLCIYNPLNKKEILKKSKKKINSIFNKNKKIKILNIGRYTDQKDQITLLKGLKLIKNKIPFEAIIVGRGVKEKLLKDYIKNNDLHKHVKLMKFTQNPFPIMKQCDLFILSSKFEGLPNVLLEALVLKKFIISSNCSTGPKEILLNGNGGLLFKVGNEIGLSKQMNYFYNNRHQCNKMLEKSYKELWRFDYNNNLKKYDELISSFI